MNLKIVVLLAVPVLNIMLNTFASRAAVVGTNLAASLWSPWFLVH